MSFFKRLKDRITNTGIRGKLVISLIIFTLFVLVSIWVFQIRLLDYFYEREKFSELESAAEDLTEAIEDGTLSDRVHVISEKRSICIRVFSISGASAREVADANVGADCLIHHLSNSLLSDLYDSARLNGGTYDKRMEFNKEFFEKESGDGDFYLPGLHHPSNTVNAIYVKILQHGDQEYLLVLDSDLTPVSATVKTLQVQFLWTAFLLLVAALVFALILSKIIVTPLASITLKAGKLATGDYEVSFDGSGYREVKELADVLNFAAKEIGATDRLQKELIANISHDLRTPLTMIKGYSEIMRDIPGENNAENVQVIIDETTRLSELVSDLLDISKLQAGAKKPEPEVFDLVSLTEETMKRYESLVKHNGYRIEFFAKESVLVYADRTMILQVIYNLINNAINYTGESMTVRVEVRRKGESVRLSVIDKGEGISPEKLDHIWDRYYCVDRVHKRAVMGTGLGLSIVKSVLEAHHAQYGVESALGVGSIFWFELPTHQSEE